MSFRISRALSTSKPTVGSSKMSTGGSCATVRAIDTFCFMPWEAFERASAYSPGQIVDEIVDALARDPPDTPLMRAKNSSVSRAVRRG